MYRSIAVAALLLAACGLGAHAQQAPTAIVVATCGTPPATYSAGVPAPLTMNTSGQLCNAASGGGGGSGTVTSVGETFTGGLISVAGSPITTAGTFALTVAGTSGGIPYFSGATTWASSAALAANALVIGGGAGASPATTTTGTGVLTALGINVGSAGAFVTFNGALGTPSSGVATNLTGLPIAGLTGLGSGVATALAIATNTAGGPLVATAALTANALVMGGGSGVTPASTSLGLVTPTALSTPAAPVITNSGTPGSTTYSYVVVGINAVGNTVGSTAGTTTTGNATLSGSNFNIVSTTALTGAVTFDIFRTVPTLNTTPGAGLIATGITPGGSFNDTGAVFSQGSGGLSPPTANTTQGISFGNINASNYNNLPLQLFGAAGSENINIGPRNTSSARYSLTFGSDVTNTSNFGTAIGMNASNTGYASTIIGYQSIAGTGDHNVSIGDHAAVNSTAIQSIAIGALADITGTGQSVVVGYNSSTSAAPTQVIGNNSSAGGQYSVVLGNFAVVSSQFSIAIGNTGTTNAQGAIGIGYATNHALTSSIGLGVFGAPVATHQFMLGGPRDDGTFYVNSMRLGAASTTANPFNVFGADVTGSNVAGSDITINTGASTGTGLGGNFKIRTTIAGTTGSTKNTLSDALAVSGAGSLILGNAALDAAATDGFIYIATTAGTPTGVPTSVTGRVAMVYDTTNHQFWIYDGGWKQPKTPAAAAVVNWQ